MKKIQIILLASGIIWLTSCIQESPSIRTGLEGKQMPSFTFIQPDSDNKLFTNSIPPGHPSIFFLFNPYCPYCRAEVNDIMDHFDRFKDVNFFLISGFSIKEIKKFRNDYNLQRFPNIKIGSDPTNTFVNYFDVKAVPYFAIYDKDKRLKSALIGQVTLKELRKSLVD